MSYTKEVQEALRKTFCHSLLNEIYVDHPKHELTTVESIHVHVSDPSLAKRIEVLLRTMPNNVWTFYDNYKGIVFTAFETEKISLEIEVA